MTTELENFEIVDQCEVGSLILFSKKWVSRLTSGYCGFPKLIQVTKTRMQTVNGGELISNPVRYLLRMSFTAIINTQLYRALKYMPSKCPCDR